MTTRYEIVHGAKYEETKHLNQTQIAALIRADVKAALPGFKVSVAKAPRGRTIRVCVKGAPAGFVVQRPGGEHAQAWARQNGAVLPWLTDEAAKVQVALEMICDAYNFDGSDIQSDYFHVRFYVSVSWDLAEVAPQNVIALPARVAPDFGGLEAVWALA